jgi:hypothetical protein
MRDYPAKLLQRYLDGEVSMEVCVGYKNGYALKWVKVDMVYYIGRAADFVRRAYGHEEAKHAENGS